MLDVAAHMLLLQRQAQIKGERPHDASFLPLSLTLACLLRQLPSGLAPPSGSLSFHQIDCLPVEILAQKIDELVASGDVISLMQSLVLYVKTTRALLSICHAHLSNQMKTTEAIQALVGCVVGTLAPEDEHHEENEQQEEISALESGSESPQEDQADDQDEEEEEAMEPVLVKRESKVKKVDDSRQQRTRRRKQPHGERRPEEAPRQKMKPAVALDPSGIMKRALARDVGDGSAVVETMKKFIDDIRIQTHGVRALKSVIRKFPAQQLPTKKKELKQQALLGGSSSDSGEGDGSGDDSEAEAAAQRRRDVVQLVIASMRRAPDHLALQRDGLFCLLDFASQSDSHLATITSLGGIVSIMEAMARLPDDEEAQIAALSILGHPMLAEDSVLRVDPESRRLVMSAMRRFPLSERLQGLGCLSLANLSLRQDESMREIVARGGLELVITAMTRFHDVSLVQAAGSWLLSTVSSKDDVMLAACLDAGGLPACEKARVRFATDPRVQQHAVLAIQSMVRDVPPSQS